LDEAKVGSLVLFNAFFQPDIDIQKEKHKKVFNLTQKGDYKKTLRYTGMLYGNIKADICSSRGVFTGEDVVKLILSGATTVQVVSSVYKHGVERIASIKNGITEWMQQKGYNNLDEFRGKLANVNLDKNEHSLVYKRAQYVDLMLTSETIFGNFQ
jgi:dihydroorotate dehydrogenase (fumarate)